MNFVNNLKISVKLIGGFVLIAIISGIVGAFGITYIKTINDADTRLYQNYTVPISQLGDIAIAFQRTRVNVRDLILSKDAKESQTYVDTIKTLSGDIDKLSAEYKSLILSQDMRDKFDKFTSDYQTYITDRVQIQELALAGKNDEAVSYMRGNAFAIAKATEADIDATLIMKVEQAKTVSNENTATANQATNIMLIISLVAILLAMGSGIFLATSITVPLAVLADISKKLTFGDLQRDMEVKVKNKFLLRNDEIGAIGKSVLGLTGYMGEMGLAAKAIARNDLTANLSSKSEKDELGIAFIAMINGLRGTVGEICDSAANLTAASVQLASASNQSAIATSQISSTVQQVAIGTANQTSSITSTASAIDQMAKAIEGVAKGAQEQSLAISKASEITAEINIAIQQVAGNAESVTRDSASASSAARIGAATVEETLRGMQSIKAKVGVSAEKVQEMGKRSEEIGVIVETIEDIASQTNLLALNAAIEAARAGEQGKGFAVVADEVRKLAERSSQATREIGGLIAGIQKTVSEAVKAMDEGSKEVEIGVISANKAGSALSDILTAAQAVNSQAMLAGEAAEKMNASAGELVTAVDSVSAVVEENTAATEEMAANSTEVTQAIESIASVSEENSAAIEQVSASAEEMTAQVEEVTASAQSLADLAQNLQKVIDRFKMCN